MNYCKLNLILGITFLFSYCSIAQEAFDYFENNPEWYVQEATGNPFSDPNWTEANWSYYLSGDSIVEGITYHKVYRRGSISGGNISYIYSDTFYHLIRQDNYKIYGFWPNGNEEILFMDFDFEVGDTLTGPYYVYEGSNMVVESIDSLEINGNQHRIFYFDGEIDFFVEGIGSDFGNMTHTPFQTLNGGSNLGCYFQNEEFLYPINGSEECGMIIRIDEEQLVHNFKIYPNPAKDILAIELADKINTTYRILSQDGKIIKSAKINITSKDLKIDIGEFQPGFYIFDVDGIRRTFVVE